MDGVTLANGVDGVTAAPGSVAQSTVSKLKQFLTGLPSVSPYPVITTAVATAIASAATTTLVVTSPTGFPSGNTYIAAALIPVAFTASVSGAAAGTLTAATTVGSFWFTFANGETRFVTVAAGGTAASWVGALQAGGAAVTTATQSEYMQVTAGMGTTSWTVTRGYAGTTALASIPAGSSVQLIQLAHQRSAINSAPFTASPVISPPGTAGYNAATIFGQFFPQQGPVYVTQNKRLAQRPPIITADFAASGVSVINVDSTAMLPQSGNIMVNTPVGEDISVNVAGPTSLNVVARAQNGTTAQAIAGSTTTLFPLYEVDFGNGGGSQAFLAHGGLNSGQHYLGAAACVGAWKEYSPEQPICFHFIHSGQIFELLCSGNINFLVIADGVIQNPPQLFTEGAYAGNFWHQFDFGSIATRKITVIAACYPMAMAYAQTASVLPWDRSQDPLISWDGDSYGQGEGFTWQSIPNGGGLGVFFEIAFALGFTQFDYTDVIGGTGYLQQTAAAPPTFPRPKYSSANRASAVTAGPAPTLFFCGQGHNDTSTATPPGVVNGSTGSVGTTTGTTLVVSSNAGYPTNNLPFVAALGTELMLVTGINGLNWTVQRGYAGSTAAVQTNVTISAAAPALFTAIASYFSAIRAAWATTVLAAGQFWQTGSVAGTTFYVRACLTSAILQGLQAAGGPWIFVDPILGTWQNSSGLSGTITAVGSQLITGQGWGGAPGYAGGHSTGIGNADLMIRDDDIHPSNVGSRYLGVAAAQAIRTAALGL